MRNNEQIENKIYFLKEHLLYEMVMFKDSILESLKLPVKDNYTDLEHFYRNMFLETCANHGRNLINFFFYELNNRNEKHRPDDAAAFDFFISKQVWDNLRGEMPIELKNFKFRVGKEIFHLTYSRKKDGEEPIKWDLTETLNALNTVMKKFFENLPNPYKDIIIIDEQKI